MRGVEERIPVWKAVPLGLQHALSMDVYIVPFLIGTALGLPAGLLASLIAASLVAAGVASLIQSQLCLRLPLMQGPSYVPIGAMVAIAASAGGGLDGIGTAVTALIPGALLLCLVGWPLRLFHRVIRRLVPPLVGGAVIVVVGITLMPVAIQADVLADAPERLNGNLLLAMASAALLVTASLGGGGLRRAGAILRSGSVLVALLGGSLLAFAMGRLDLSPVRAASWVARPRFIGIDFPFHVQPGAMLAMLLVYAVVLAETTGTWLVVSAITGQPFGEKQADRGALGEGLGCLVSALLGSTPVTGYSANGGVIALTGVSSRRVFAVAALFLVAFGLCGKLAAFIACVPAPVIGGIFGVLCVVILMNGLRILARASEENGHDERTAMVTGLPILLGLGTALLPRALIADWPLPVRELFGSATAVGAGAAVLLNLVLPARRTPLQRAERPASLPPVQTEATLAREAP
ncbi:purine/pyrimidine permease [Acetobacteraceae bacterium KSS8]|uniref:Purine/pyrimidine permease n=1 Tax=Endosaccharibacter trunci TaxID=2812733 RepID=A0ABT1W702_9PROT|nr:purine/pyrimidine permease [Acetobacteraceae bacterium KSS8]